VKEAKEGKKATVKGKGGGGGGAGGGLRVYEMRDYTRSWHQLQNTILPGHKQWVKEKRAEAKKAEEEKLAASRERRRLRNETVIAGSG